MFIEKIRVEGIRQIELPGSQMYRFLQEPSSVVFIIFNITIVTQIINQCNWEINRNNLRTIGLTQSLPPFKLGSVGADDWLRTGL